MIYYECHVTVIGNREQLEYVVDSLGWKFSAIDGDPTLGVGVKCYATKHYKANVSAAAVVEHVRSCAHSLRLASFEVLRDKVELVLHDSKVFREAA